MALPEMKVCPRCKALLPVVDDMRYPTHRVGDLPVWMGDPLCALSGQAILRRAPIPAAWWHKYIQKP